jgi:hypothetical protein
VDVTYDLELRMIAAEYTAIRHLTGTAELPDGSPLKARLLLVKVKVGKPGAQHCELFAFGFQAKGILTGPNDLAETKLTLQPDSDCIYKGTVLDNIPCFIVAASP